ncbi:unnamed protein product, partial [Closterium sp. NIES-53]
WTAAVTASPGRPHTSAASRQSQQETFSPQVLSELLPQRCVTGSVESTALGASESAASLGARASPTTGPSSAEALHTFTLDSGASLCFFRDYTSLTPLAAPVPVSLADPTGGPVVARASTVLPCPAVPFGSLSGLHLPTFSTNLVSNAAIQDVWVVTFIPGGQCVAICTCSRTGRHLATFTRRPGTSLYTLTTASAHVAEAGQVAASSQVSASGQLEVSCSCQVLSHQTLLWHHRLGHPSLPRLRGMHSRLLVTGLPRSLPPLPRSAAPPCLICVDWRQRAAPHSSEFPPTTAPLQTFHMDVQGQAPVSGTDQEHYFLLVVDAYTCYTTVFLLRCKADVSGVLIPCIRATRRQLRERFSQDYPGALFLVSDAKANKLSSRTLRCVFLGFPTDAPPRQLYHPCSRRVFSSQDVTFDESVCYYMLHPHAFHPGPVPSGVSQVDPPPLVEPLEVSSDSSGSAEGGDLATDDTAATRCSPRLDNPPGFPPWPSSLPPWPAAVDSGAETAGVEPGGAETEGEGSWGSTSGGAGSWGAATGGADSGVPASPSGGGAVGDPTGGYGPAGAGAASPRGNACARGTGGIAGGAGGAVGAGDTRGAAGAGGVRATSPRGATRAGGAGPTSPGGTAGARGAGAVGAGGTARAAGAGGAGAAGAGGAGAAGTALRRQFFYPQPQSSLPPPDSVLRQVLSLPSSTGLPLPLLCPSTDHSQPQILPGSPLPALAPHTEVTESLTERREPETHASTPVRARRVARPRPPAVPGTHGMALHPSSVPQRVVLREPPVSSLPHVPDPEFALVIELVEFATSRRLDYVASLVSESESVYPPSVGGELALGSDVLEDIQFELECLAATLPRFASMLLCPGGDPDALDIPTPRSYAEAIAGGYSFQLQIAMDVDMASWKSTGTYVDEVPPPGANIVDGMWMFRVKRPPGSSPAFKARYVARGFRQQQGVDFFQTFSPTPKMTTLWVLLHVAAERDYELHSLDFSTAFLQGSLHEEIWLRRPPRFTRSFPAGTQWSLRRPVYGLRQTPREWHDTLRTTLVALGFAPSSADPSLFLRTDTTLPAFYVLVYPTPLSTGHLLSAPPSDESVEPSGPYSELVDCLIISGMGLVLGGQGSVILTGHSDASWADDQATQCSSQGYTFSLGSGSVSWRSTRSSYVLSSRCEAEIYDGAMAAQELCWLTYLLTDLGEQPRSPPVLYVDNKAMLAMYQEQRLEHRTNHIALCYFLARELQQRRQLRLSYVASRANTADVFTMSESEGLGFESQCVHFGHPSAGGCQRSTGDPRLIVEKGYRLVFLGSYGRTDPLLNKPFYPNGLVVGILTHQGL